MGELLTLATAALTLLAAGLGIRWLRSLLHKVRRPRRDPRIWHQVVRVIDGDTLDVNMNGVIVRVRVLGIDTPETVHPDKPVEHYGPEATREAKRLLVGYQVRIDTDPFRRQHVDKWGRLLAYVALPDGTDYGLRMLEAGYARENTFAGQRYMLQATYQDAQLRAWGNRRGLWGAWTPPTRDTTSRH